MWRQRARASSPYSFTKKSRYASRVAGSAILGAPHGASLSRGRDGQCDREPRAAGLSVLDRDAQAHAHSRLETFKAFPTMLPNACTSRLRSAFFRRRARPLRARAREACAAKPTATHLEVSRRVTSVESIERRSSSSSSSEMWWRRRESKNGERVEKQLPRRRLADLRLDRLRRSPAARCREPRDPEAFAKTVAKNHVSSMSRSRPRDPRR